MVPSGTAGVRVSQVSGTVGGTIYPGIHFVSPLVQHVEFYNVRQVKQSDGADRWEGVLRKRCPSSGDIEQRHVGRGAGQSLKSGC